MKGGHVWHCSLTLRAEEGQLTDEKCQVAEEFVDRTGFGDQDGIKARCGGWRSVTASRPTATARRRARAWFERRAERGERPPAGGSLTAAQREALGAAEMKADQPRWELVRNVRGCATASVDEAQLVRRLRQRGVLAAPTW